MFRDISYQPLLQYLACLSRVIEIAEGVILFRSLSRNLLINSAKRGKEGTATTSFALWLLISSDSSTPSQCKIINSLVLCNFKENG